MPIFTVHWKSELNNWAKVEANTKKEALTYVRQGGPLDDRDCEESLKSDWNYYVDEGDTGQGSITKIKVRKVVGECPEMEIFFDGIPVNCRIDSGSQVTTMVESCYNQHFRNRQPIEECRWINLSAANGLNIPIVGLMIAQINIGGKLISDAHILVVRDPDDPYMATKKQSTPGVVGCNIITPLYQQVTASSGSKQELVHEDRDALEEGLLNYKHHIMAQQIETQLRGGNTGNIENSDTKANNSCRYSDEHNWYNKTNAARLHSSNRTS